jgi:hypothetical protein
MLVGHMLQDFNEISSKLRTIDEDKGFVKQTARKKVVTATANITYAIAATRSTTLPTRWTSGTNLDVFLLVYEMMSATLISKFLRPNCLGEAVILSEPTGTCSGSSPPSSFMSSSFGKRFIIKNSRKTECQLPGTALRGLPMENGFPGTTKFDYKSKVSLQS